MAEGLSRIHVPGGCCCPDSASPRQASRVPRPLALRAEMAGRSYDPASTFRASSRAESRADVEPLERDGAADSRELNWMFTSDRLRMPKGVHVVDAWLSMLGVIGLPATPARFPLRPPADALRAARDYIESLGPSGPIVIMNVGSSKPDRRWPAERFAEVARMAHSQTKALCVFTWGNDSEKELAGMAVEQAGEAGVLSLKTDLFLLAGLIRHADAFVGGDTGHTGRGSRNTGRRDIRCLVRMEDRPVRPRPRDRGSAGSGSEGPPQPDGCHSSARCLYCPVRDSVARLRAFPQAGGHRCAGRRRLIARWRHLQGQCSTRHPFAQSRSSI